MFVLKDYRYKGLEPLLRHLKGVPKHLLSSSHKSGDCAECTEVQRMAIRVVSIVSVDSDIRKMIRNFGTESTSLTIRANCWLQMEFH